MPVKVRLKIKDAFLEKALEIMVREAGFALAEQEDDCPYLITDGKGDISEEYTALCVTREYENDRLCLVRPFGEDDLRAALDKLTSNTHSDSGREKSGVRIDRKRSLVYIAGQKARLTEKEMQLFLLLYEAKGKAVSDSEIVSQVWKNETAYGSNIAAVYVNYLRKKIEKGQKKRLIHRVRGEGYALKIEEEGQ